VAIPKKGYGSALLGGIDAACGRFVIMADADDSYDFSQLDAFVEGLRAGNTMVIGHRFRGGIRPGAMPLLHRYLGNPLLSFAGRLFFSTDIGDFHWRPSRSRSRSDAAIGPACFWDGVRERDDRQGDARRLAHRRGAHHTLARRAFPRTASAQLARRVAPTCAFLLMMSPRWLMLYPGSCLIGVGAAAEIAILHGPVVICGVGFDIHTMLYAAGAIILGVQLVLFSLLARTVGVLKALLPMSPALERFLRVLYPRARHCARLVGSVSWGLALAIYSVDSWAHARLAALDPATMMRWRSRLSH